VVYQKIDQVMIGNMIDKANVGYYAVAGAFVSVAIFIPNIICQTLTPLLVQYYNTNRNLYHQRAQLFLNIMVWSSIFLAVLVFLLAYPIVRYTYGSQYIEAIPVLQILIFKIVGTAMMSSSGNLMIIEGVHRYAAIRNGLACVANVVLNLILIPKLGIVGAAIAGVVALMVAGYFAHFVIPPYFRFIKPQTKSLLLGWKDLVNIRKLMKE
ncbi:MAG: polysaccharide biosynthesis C-terminal domain-containing protein, partial [Lachnospiraceae bacterium]